MVPPIQHGLLNPTEISKMLQKLIFRKAQENEIYVKDPLTQTNYLKVMEKVTFMASIWCINQANILFRVNKHSYYTNECMYKIKNINSLHLAIIDTQNSDTILAGEMFWLIFLCIENI